MLGSNIDVHSAPLKPKETLEKTVRTIAVDQIVHKQGKQWETEQNSLLEEMRQASLELLWYERQEQTFQRYVETATGRVNELNRSMEELSRMENELEGELIHIYDELVLFVEDDIPFQMEERRDRLAFIAKSVADYELPLSEKLRRVCEALQAELSYSVDVEWGPGTILIEGSHQGVTFVRAGRVGYYALALDGSKGWHWTFDEGFSPLDGDGVASLRTAVNMLKVEQYDTLPTLPILEAK